MRAVVSSIEQNAQLDQPAGAYARFSGEWSKHDPVKNLVSGSWLGHQLHPMLSDLPIGAWGAATFLDLVGGRESASAAQKLVGAGILAAVPTAASGASDYSETYGSDQRVGFVHGMANVAGVVLQAGSWLARRRGHRGLGVALSATGFGVTSAAAYLGGHLTLVKGVGVNHTAFEHGTSGWTDVVSLSELAEGRPHQATVGGVDVVLVRQGSTVRALSSRCTHAGGPLHEGSVQDGCLVCPWHGSRFRLTDGSVDRGPASVPQPVWQTRVEGDRVSVRRDG